MIRPLKKILSNPHYVGNIVQGRETSISVTNKRRQSLPQSEWVIVSDTHEPIISREDFERIQELIKAKESKGKGKIRKQKHMFSGLIFCADCGKAMHRRRISGNSYYSCGSYVRGGSKYCTSHTIKEDNLKQAIIDDINAMIANVNSGDIYNRIERKVKKLQSENTKKLQSLEDEIKKLVERKGGLIDLLADGVIDKAAYQERVKVTEEKLRSLEIKVYELKKDFDIDATTNKLNLLKKELNKFVNFEDLSREMLHRLIERIEICADRTTVKVYYRFARTA